MGRSSAKAGKKVAIIIIKNPSRNLKITSNLGTAPATKNPEAALSSLPEVINYHAGKGL